MLVAIEGLDGAGKRTQSELMVARARAQGISCSLISFPRYRETESALLVASYLNGEYGELDAIDPHLSALLYAMDRFESRELVIKQMASNDLVVVDRYVTSNLAYQTARIAIARRAKFIAWLASVEYDLFGLPPADLTLYLAVTPVLSRHLVAQKDRRVYTDAKADLHERNSSLLQSCAFVYEELSERQYRGKWSRIECMDQMAAIRSPEAISEDLWTIVATELDRRTDLVRRPST